MTLIHAPWAIDGARSTSALARVSTYATGGGRSGIVRPTDLKVTPLSPEGNGVRIASGSAIILNGYQTTPREAYAVANNGTHTVLSADMPAPVPQTAHYLVCVVVGDPEFNQAGHPFMPSEILPEEAADYEYVRAVIVPCNADTNNFEQLGLNYPAYALARLEIPANTTTISAAMITDLRAISAPRQERVVLSGASSPGNPITLTTERVLSLFGPSVTVPPWATTAIITATITGLIHENPDVSGFINIHSSADNSRGPQASYEFEATGNVSGIERVALQATWTKDVSAIAGQPTFLSLEALRAGGAGQIRSAGINSGTMLTFDVQFIEAVR